MKKLPVSETKPQYAIFDWIVDLPIIRILKPLYEWKRGFWIYCFLGFLSVVIDFIVTFVLEKIIPSAAIGSVIAWMCSTLASFVMFRYLYFDRTDNSFMNELIKFIPTRLFTMAVSALVMLIFVDNMHCDLLTVKIILVPVTAILNYFTSKIFVFK